jgi:hypothetical protein
MRGPITINVVGVVVNMVIAKTMVVIVTVEIMGIVGIEEIVAIVRSMLSVVIVTLTIETLGIVMKGITGTRTSTSSGATMMMSRYSDRSLSTY